MVFRLATETHVSGLVRNDRAGVFIEVEGTVDSVEKFLALLPERVPSAARVDGMDLETMEPRFERGFAIVASDADSRASASAIPPPDLAPCAACIEELFDPGNRRHRYPFINCTGCGPRFTIVRELPYDRPNTTMDRFVLCPDCRREYEDPLDRRFHAEPTACPACGPRLELTDAAAGVRAVGEAALAEAAEMLRSGRIVALKGVGGYALAVDATSEAAVARLRERKGRRDKPFAVMVPDLAHAEAIACLDDHARAVLVSPMRPIVLAPIQEGHALARSVAPRLREVGVFLPPTALQLLLATDGPPFQVMTSGNVSGAPIAAGNAEAVAALAHVADAFLAHDRQIHARADDSVLRGSRAGIAWIRRARGVVPERIAIPVSGPPVLAVGGGYKNTVCIAQDGAALMSPHLGDLDHPDVARLFRESVDHLRNVLDVDPAFVAHDLHPDYGSTQWARRSGMRCVPVQHHHAHAAACLAEHGRRDPAIAVVFDGTGLGDDGTLWGGEFLVASLTRYERLGRLSDLPLPGGEAAIREPARLGVAALLEARLEDVAPPRLARLVPEIRRITGLRFASPVTSSAGRWFDAVAALCGLDEPISYDAQAAIELEALAAAGEFPPYETVFDTNARPFVADLTSVTRGIVRDLSRGVPRAGIAARFHETMAVIVLEGCRRIRRWVGQSTVALSGGCFQNRRLTERVQTLLAADGFEVLTHRLVPPNDGGLSLGQAAVATSRLIAIRSEERTCA